MNTNIKLMRSKPSIRDVAEQAGVSLSTVSSVLTDRKGARIGEQTKFRVKEIATRLGYHPNNIGRALSSGRTYSLGVLMAHMSSFQTDDMLLGAFDEARERGYQLQISYYHFMANSLEPALHDLTRHDMDGILSIASRSGDDLDVLGALSSCGYPFTLAFYGEETDLADAVVVDQQQGAYLATEHLLKRGHRRIAFAGGLSILAVVHPRVAGWRQALRDWNIPEDDAPLVLETLHADGGIQAVEILAASGRGMPDAIVAFDDGFASGVLRGLRRRGLKVPDDVAVVGFNDTQLVCDACDPPLTSICMPLSQVGRGAAKLLIDRLEDRGDWSRKRIALPCTITVRESA